MVKEICCKILLLLGLGMMMAVSLQAQPVPAQGLAAFVDRTDITISDLVTLTIRVDAALGNNRPSFQGLNRDFEQVGGVSTRSTYTNNNGNIQSWTEYNISLRPNATGTFTIPGFTVAGQTTNPITIKVGDASEIPASGNDEIFLRTNVSKEDMYVQEQLLYTIRIYYSIGFDQGAQLSSPQVADAVVQQLGSDENFQEVVDGIGYNVTERRFVIYPQASGELVIPPVYFSASVGRRGGINRLFNNRSQVREINLTSDGHSINIKARPATFPGETWLPASELTLAETWSGELDTVKVGDAITRNVVLTANGLSSSLLPGIAYEDLPGLRFYPDQPVREDVADRTGVVGKRSEGTAMVASRAGEFELPEVRMPWWNTTTDTLETAVLPARTITVLPAGEADSDPAAVTPDVSENPAGQASSFSPGAGGGSADILWISTTAVFGLAWLLTLFLWLNSRRQLQYAETVGVPVHVRMPDARQPTTPENSQKLPDATACLRVLKTACDNSNYADIKKALVKWGQASFQTGSIQTLAQVAEHCRDEQLSSLVLALDAALYGSSQGFDSKALYNTVAALHKQGVKPANATPKYGLPPLYKH